MSNVIQSFLVGIGFDFDTKGAKQVDSAIDGVKSRALQLGAVLAGAFGVKAMTVDFANAYDEIGKFSKVFGMIPQDVYALGSALEREGGSMQQFMQEVQQLEEMRAGLLRGDADFIARAGIAGLDTGPLIAAKNATEGYLELADQFQRMSQQQRINAAQALGLSKESIILLSQGEKGVRAAMQREAQRNGLIQDATKVSREFNSELHDTWKNMGAFADRISVKMLPELSNLVGGMNDWIDANRDLINQNIDKVLQKIADNIGIISTVAAAFTGASILKFFAGLASIVPGVSAGITATASGLARMSGIAGTAVVGYDIYQNAAADERQIMEAQNAIWRTTPEAVAASRNLEAMGWTTANKPVVNVNVTNQTDGTMVRTTVNQVIEESNQRAIDELTSSTGG